MIGIGVTPIEPGATRRLAMHVLVVEDEPVVRRFFKRLLARLVDSVSEAEDGQQALEQVTEAEPGRRPDLVLSDLAMPRLNGIELAKRLQQLDASVPVVLVTAYDPPELEPMLEDGVIAGLLRKPTQLESLRRELERHAPSGGSTVHPRPAAPSGAMPDGLR